jgi:uncharacterized protein (DUF1330 family)
VLEGEWRAKRLVVLEFDELEAVKRWYDSPDYRDARTLREGAASLLMVAVEGQSLNETGEAARTR